MIKLEGDVLRRFKAAESPMPFGYQGINSNGYYGDFQIGVSGTFSGKKHNHPEWVSWGGKQEEIGKASADRQLEVARVGFNQKQKSLASLIGRQPEDWEIYAAWNIGEGNVAKLIKAASEKKTLSQSGARIFKQAWGNDSNLANASCMEVLNRLKTYFMNGKIDATVLPNPDNHTVDVVPGADSSIQTSGLFGGTIDLYANENTTLKNDFFWTTTKKNTPSQTFYLPEVLAQAGEDTFIDINGNIAKLTTEPETMSPRVLTNKFDCYFKPLTLANNTPIYARLS